MASFVGVQLKTLLKHRNLSYLIRNNGFIETNNVLRIFCRTLRALTDLTKDDVDTILRRKENSTLIGSGAIHSYDTNQLPANSPCEDNYSEAKCLTTNAWLFGIFDGHAGFKCSKIIARRLYDYLSLCVMPKQKLQDLSISFNDTLVQWYHCSGEIELDEAFKQCHQRNLQRFVAHCLENYETLSNVRKAFQLAFTTLDHDLSRDALPDSRGATNPARVALVASGSCACVAHVRDHHLHMANVGDSVGVMGVCNDEGVWSARQLTKLHCIENADEVKRIRNEHPAKETTTVLRGGRLLGQLFPLRAFGDVRYKWTATTLQTVLEPVVGQTVVPPHLETPPYLTAQPEVFYHRLTPNDKFLVVASDGLWEILSPEKVVRLISDHMVGRQTLNLYNPAPSATFGEIMDELRTRKKGESKRPLDANSATHLIRNALGGGGTDIIKQYTALGSTLSHQEGKTARSFRDDITITVVYFDPVFLATSGQTSDQSVQT